MKRGDWRDERGFLLQPACWMGAGCRKERTAIGTGLDIVHLLFQPRGSAVQPINPSTKAIIFFPFERENDHSPGTGLKAVHCLFQPVESNVHPLNLCLSCNLLPFARARPRSMLKCCIHRGLFERSPSVFSRQAMTSETCQPSGVTSCLVGAPQGLLGVLESLDLALPASAY